MIGGAGLIGAFFAYDKFFNYGADIVETNSIQQEVSDFEGSVVIFPPEYREDGAVRFVYRSCNAPKIPYTLSFVINGTLVDSFEFDPNEFAKAYTEDCGTFYGKWFEPVQYPDIFRPGDKLELRYYFGEYGSFTTYLSTRR